MLKPSVEHGCKMDIDLITGPIKPKTTASETPHIADNEGAVIATGDFSALLEAGGGLGAAIEDGTQESDSGAVPHLALPEQALAVSTDGPEVGSKDGKDKNPDDPTQTPPFVPVLNHVQAQATNPESQQQIIESAALVSPKATAPKAPPRGDGAPFIPDDRKAPQANKPEADIAAAQSPADKPKLAHLAPQAAVNAQSAGALPAQSSVPAPLAAKAGARQPEVQSDPPDIRPAKQLQSTPTFAPKSTAQSASLPGFITDAHPHEHKQPDRNDIQFGIKIERHLIETAALPRHIQPAQPVAQQITSQLPHLLTKTEKQTVELKLDPPELGRVTIHLSTHDQQVTAHIVADRGDTVDLMRRHAEVLNATLARAGFSNADLSFQQGQPQNQNQELEQFRGFISTSEGDAPADISPTPGGLDGRLDVRL